MSAGRKLQSRLISLAISARTRSTTRALRELRRRMTGRQHIVSAFLQLDDPWSYLLAQYLPELADNYDIELRYFLIQACGDAYQPRPDMLARYAVEDCERLARELGLPFLDRGNAPPVEHRRALIDALARVDRPDFDAELLAAITMYWRGDSEGVARRISGLESTGAGDGLLEKNQQTLVKLGHYNSAMLHYEGEWYWGVDRLHYLTDRLDQLGIRRESAATAQLASITQAMQINLPVAPPGAAQRLPPLEYFYSFRSPYSYLSLDRVFDLADAFGLTLKIRPVLPMVMRGLQVPKQKLIYVVKDTAREAERMQILFGSFADPLGKGVERCMSVYHYAVGEKRERDFLRHVGEAIWARGIDVATDNGMRKVTARTGLFWPDVVAAMRDDAWREEVEENRASMEASGSWGVPTLRLGDLVVWGQDRIWMLAREVEELCDTGDGILV